MRKCPPGWSPSTRRRGTEGEELIGRRAAQCQQVLADRDRSAIALLGRRLERGWIGARHQVDEQVDAAPAHEVLAWPGVAGDREARAVGVEAVAEGRLDRIVLDQKGRDPQAVTLEDTTLLDLGDVHLGWPLVHVAAPHLDVPVQPV